MDNTSDLRFIIFDPVKNEERSCNRLSCAGILFRDQPAQREPFGKIAEAFNRISDGPAHRLGGARVFFFDSNLRHDFADVR